MKVSTDSAATAPGSAADPGAWDAAPLPQLVRHIIGVFHVPLRSELPRLEAMAQKVLEVHGGDRSDPETEPLAELHQLVRALSQELLTHMQKEEQILFPMIERGQGQRTMGPVRVMQMEHVQAERMLDRLSELTKNYRVPQDACSTWRTLWEGLEALDRDLRMHIHLENDILFPRALEGS